MAATLRRLILLVSIFSSFLCRPILGWDEGDFEIFDAVEEVNQNFYEFLEVSPDASSKEIRKAYRKLTLKHHPDKNKEAEAEITFRKLVSVYEILKDEDKRKRYDKVLVEGLPDWRQPIFYYRRVRKMGLGELFILLAGIGTIGQFLTNWAVYFEKKLVVVSFIIILYESKRRKC
ncbi:hypothetical protein LOTGIDRAFT_126787 [Lottia gigantea]|uniref:J domain-containing protein n=1 Tax=Lottia gigantea TaxID=225164 RepID=V3ZAG7_LOTGI|nr:hypothetical protein LOTGIDRAFT_126787 [Lottia gigantea]ESO87958.1 hypothetical protein LOTGIDRAFT_126787 [Lottia gigantea]